MLSDIIFVSGAKFINAKENFNNFRRKTPCMRYRDYSPNSMIMLDFGAQLGKFKEYDAGQAFIPLHQCNTFYVLTPVLVVRKYLVCFCGNAFQL